MCFPTVNNNFYVFFYNRFYDCYLLLLETVIVNLLYWLYIIFSFAIVLYNVNMYGVMVIGVKEESVAKEDKYCWHIICRFVSYGLILNYDFRKGLFDLNLVAKIAKINENKSKKAQEIMK